MVIQIYGSSKERDIRHCQQVFFSLSLSSLPSAHRSKNRNDSHIFCFLCRRKGERNEIMTMIVITWACHNSSSFVLDRCSLNISIIVFALLTNTFLYATRSSRTHSWAKAWTRYRRMVIGGAREQAVSSSSERWIRSLFILSIRQANIDKYLTCSVRLYNYRVKTSRRETCQSTSNERWRTTSPSLWSSSSHFSLFFSSLLFISNNVCSLDRSMGMSLHVRVDFFSGITMID